MKSTGRPTRRKSFGRTRSSACSTWTWTRRQVHPVAQAKAWEIRDEVWSPDSRWVAYSQEEADGLGRVYLYSVEQDKTFAVTDPWYGSFGPAFSGDGKYLFFISNRDFNPVYGDLEFNYTYRDMARLYFVTLAKDTPSPFKPKSDEVEQKKVAEAKDEPKKDDPPKAEPKADAGVKVDTDGLSDRIVEIPVQASNYRDLASVGATVYYIRQGAKDRQAGLPDVRPVGEEGDDPRLGRRLRDFGRRQEDDRVAGRQVRDHRPGQRPRDGGRTSGPVRHGDEAGPPRGVGADLQRELAAGARLLLRPRHARRRLEGGSRQVCPAGEVRQPPRRPDVHHRRDDRRAGLRPLLRRRRRLPAPGPDRDRTARRRVEARPATAGTRSSKSSRARAAIRSCVRR